jgi:type I restriction enzyme R subunit
MERPGRLERELRLWTKNRFPSGTSAASTSHQPFSKLDGDMHKQVREEVSFIKGRIIVRGKLHRHLEANYWQSLA